MTGKKNKFKEGDEVVVNILDSEGDQETVGEVVELFTDDFTGAPMASVKVYLFVPVSQLQ